MDRRQFIKRSGLASSAFFIPGFLKPFEQYYSTGNRNIVIIQLSGGNDGLNTIIPFENDLYYQQRKSIAIAKENVIKLSDQQGFHPSMNALKEIYDQGYMSIINSVGYPNPDRSHFRSMDIWQTATDSNEYATTGWIGRYLDSNCAGCEHPYLAIESDDNLSLALKGATKKGIAVKNIRQLYDETREPFFKNVMDAKDKVMLNEDNLGYLYKTMIETSSSAGYIYETSKQTVNTYSYPDTAFAKQLKTIATFINSGLQTKVYYVSLSGFDTHVNQTSTQQRLLKEYSDAVAAFINNLKSFNKFDDTLMLTFSEFGRRVEQNASGGTDHGTASNVFIYGSNLKQKGICNSMPDLANLEDGDIKHTVDFRSVYATILQNWLGVNNPSILKRDFPLLNFI